MAEDVTKKAALQEATFIATSVVQESEAVPEAVAEAVPEDSSQAMDGYLELLSRATPDQKSKMLRALDLGGVVTKAKSRGSNAESQRISMSAGEIIHPANPDGTPWEPKVSEAVEQSGTKEQVLERWHYNQSGSGASRTTTARDAEEMADLAQM